MNFHAFWRPELKAIGDLLADRIRRPAFGPGSCRRSGSVRAADTASAAGRVAPTAILDGGLTGRRGTLCYPGAVPGV
jgi:hypothetical protein